MRAAAAVTGALRRDFLPSVVVFLVALPLCMGIAIASGVPPALGLITGIVGGLLVGFIAGSPLQVSGPAAGLAVLVWQLVQDFGLPMLGVAVLAAGALQLLAGVAKLGRWFRAVSPAVIQGMLAGIGVLILVSQFYVMLDLRPPGSGLQNVLGVPGAISSTIASIGTGSHFLAALAGIATIALVLGWNQFKPKRLEAVPGALVGVVGVTAVVSIVSLPIEYVTVPANLLDSLNIPTAASFRALLDPAFIGETLGLAAIASAETLLCATAVDRMHEGPRTNYDKELVAQGIGNMTCGILGALPMTGVIVRSSANVEAGAESRASAIMHGAWLLGLVALLPFVLELIPTAALAAVLVYTGYKLLNPGGIRQLWRARRGEAVVLVSTIVAIVATDLLTGVLVGIALALAKLIVSFSRLRVVVESPDEDRRDVIIEGAATFLRLPALADALEGIPAGKQVYVHIGALAYIDHGCLELLRSFEAQYGARGGSVVVDWDALEVRSREAQLRPASVASTDDELASRADLSSTAARRPATSAR